MLTGITPTIVKARRWMGGSSRMQSGPLRGVARAVSVTGMRWLVPEKPSPGDLSEAYDWPATTWVRACMVMGLDGSIAGPDGLSGSI
jgi:nitrogenase molybdenum-iron protein alpha/beta subunit